jgi:hypothetical protein
MAPDDNHHLWRNGRYWWVAFVIVVDGVRQVRIRESLKTEDVNTARERRDACIRAYASRPGCVVPLRMEKRKLAEFTDVRIDELTN